MNCNQEGHTANYMGCPAAKNYKQAQSKATPPKKSDFPLLNESETVTESSASNSNKGRTYAQAIRNTETSENNDMSFTAMFSEIKDIFKSINISTILTKIRECSHKLKHTTDSTEKILILVETLVTIVDGCNK